MVFFSMNDILFNLHSFFILSSRYIYLYKQN